MAVQDAEGRSGRILAPVREIPEGFVRTYADIDPQAPRAVGRVLATVHAGVPWHRVVRSDGSVAEGAAAARAARREPPLPATLPSERTTRCQGTPAWTVASTRPTARGASGSMSA